MSFSLYVFVCESMYLLRRQQQCFRCLIFDYFFFGQMTYKRFYEAWRPLQNMYVCVRVSLYVGGGGSFPFLFFLIHIFLSSSLVYLSWIRLTLLRRPTVVMSHSKQKSNKTLIIIIINSGRARERERERERELVSF